MIFWLNNGREIHIRFLVAYFWPIFFYAKLDGLIVEYIFDLHFILAYILHPLLAYFKLDILMLHERIDLRTLVKAKFELLET